MSYSYSKNARGLLPNPKIKTNVWPRSNGPLFREAWRQQAMLLSRSHSPPSNLQKWKEVRLKLRKRLLHSLGSWPKPPKLSLKIHRSIQMDNYRILCLTYQSRTNLRVTANLFIPAGKGPFPGILNLHGHWLHGKATPMVASRGHLLAQSGFVVLSIDSIGSGERGTTAGKFDYHGNQQGASLLSVSETLLGMQVYDNMRGIDLLQSLDFVDGDRIGVTGESGGGNQTMWLSALDPRVKASVPVVSIGTFQSYVTNANCWCETLPDGLPITEEWAVLGMIAPRPLLLLTALREKIPAFLPSEAARSYHGARKIYQLMGAADRISFRKVDTAHGYFPEMQRHMLGWFNQWLLRVGSGKPATIPRIRNLAESRLLCFPGKSRPIAVNSLLGYVSYRSQIAKTKFLSLRTLNCLKKRRDLARILRIPTPCLGPKDRLMMEQRINRYRIQKFTLESEPHIRIPFVLVIPTDQPVASLVITTHPDGKSAALEQPESRRALAQGKTLCLLDLRDTGETTWDPPPSQCRNAARTALWLGRTMIGNWVHDLSMARSTLARRMTHYRVELLGFRETALAALAAGALDKRFSQVSVVEMLSSYVLHGVQPVQRFSIFVPGILSWGDVSLMAAMLRCPLKVHSLVRPSGRLLSQQEFARWSREVRKVRNSLSPIPSISE